MDPRIRIHTKMSPKCHGSGTLLPGISFEVESVGSFCGTFIAFWLPLV